MSKWLWFRMFGQDLEDARQRQVDRELKSANQNQDYFLSNLDERVAKLEGNPDKRFVVSEDLENPKVEVNPLDEFMENHPRTGEKIVSGVEQGVGFFQKQALFSLLLALLYPASVSTAATVLLLVFIHPSWTTAIIFHLALFLFLAWRLRRSALKD